MIAFSLLAYSSTLSRSSFTGQAPDRIYFQGKLLPLHTNPLEVLFDKHPIFRPRGTNVSSNLDRGYIATFEIKNDTLTLRNIEVSNLIDECPGNFGNVMISVLDQAKTFLEPKDLSWYSGILTIPRGKLIRPGRAGYSARYGRYTLVNIHRGKLSGVVNLSEDHYTAFRIRQYQRYIATDEYKTWRQSMLKNDKDPARIELIDNLMFGILIDYTSVPGDQLFAGK